MCRGAIPSLAPLAVARTLLRLVLRHSVGDRLQGQARRLLRARRLLDHVLGQARFALHVSLQLRDRRGFRFRSAFTLSTIAFAVGRLPIGVEASPSSSPQYASARGGRSEGFGSDFAASRPSGNMKRLPIGSRSSTHDGLQEWREPGSCDELLAIGSGRIRTFRRPLVSRQRCGILPVECARRLWRIDERQAPHRALCGRHRDRPERAPCAWTSERASGLPPAGFPNCHTVFPLSPSLDV